MSDLKTLKDIEKYTDFPDEGLGSDKYGSYIDINDLRQEAIKWCKQYMKISRPWRETNGELFMNFFNITDEELK